MNKEQLIDFEREIEEIYQTGVIRAPVHFSGGNEEQLIKMFRNIRERDWVFSNHRSHYHALLKGVSPDWLKNQIINRKSMHINSKKHKFFTSAIVGGCLPIALGTALGAKLRGLDEEVYCFVGDMASEMGCFYEAKRYAEGHDLPIRFIIEDNGFGINTPTQEVWGKGSRNKVSKYSYKRTYPHHGTGDWVNF